MPRKGESRCGSGRRCGKLCSCVRSGVQSLLALEMGSGAVADARVVPFVVAASGAAACDAAANAESDKKSNEMALKDCECPQCGKGVW